MRQSLHVLGLTFRQRVRGHAFTTWLGYGADRAAVAAVIALVPGLVLLALVALGPAPLARQLTEPAHVRLMYARFVSAIATASTIAVSVAALTLSRELKGVRSQTARHEADQGFRDRVRRAADLDGAPLLLSGFLSLVFANVREAARAVREASDARTLARTTEGIRLDAYLDAVEEQADRVSARCDAWRAKPHRLLDVALDFEQELTSHLAHGFARLDALDARVQQRLHDLSERLQDAVVGVLYAKTLDIQWGLSRMAIAITAWTLPAILASAGMVLAYGDGAPDALGVTGAGLLVASALVVGLAPLAIFVSYVLRFLVVNEHTLPTEGFVLGPEEPDVAPPQDAGARHRGRRHGT